MNLIQNAIETLHSFYVFSKIFKKMEKNMTPEELLEILHRANMLKINTRHNWTIGERKESVADHSWRITLMAMLISQEDEFKNVDMNKVIRMCLIHDLGEAFTGDIPVFDKNKEDENKEDEIFFSWVNAFPAAQKEEWNALLKEMNALETVEAKTYKALDKLEALIAHDEADISTWLPVEYDLQLTYGKENVVFSPYLSAVKEKIDEDTRNKIKDASK